MHQRVSEFKKKNQKKQDTMRTEELEDYPQYKEAVEKCPPGNVGPRGIMPSA